jgi:hypothetical protein
MKPETCRLTGRLFDFTGQPFTAPLSLALTRSAVDADSGFILAASDRTVTPDETGLIDVHVWPTARAEKATFYELTAPRFRLKLAIPDQPAVDLLAAIVDD